MGEETRPYSESEKNMAGLGDQNRVAWGEPPAQTQIVLYEGVPLDDTYTDVYYADGGDNNAFLDTVASTKYEYTNYTYQRVNSSVAQPRKPLTLRVDENADTLYKCNYLRFLNRTDNKWFYAFIKKVNYVAPNTTEIEYEIDHFMTWFNTCTIMPCYVEREHILVDEPYANIIPEPINIEYYRHGTQNYSYKDSDAPWITIFSSETEDGDDAVGGMMANIYCGVETRSFPFSGGGQIAPYISGYEHPESILAICLSRIQIGVGGVVTKNLNTGLDITPDTINNYPYRNKKLLTSQFRYFKTVLANGNSTNLLPEKFRRTSGSVQIQCIEAHSPLPTITYVPQYYDTVSTDDTWEYALIDDEVVQCPWASDSFKQWWSENQNSYIAGICNSIIKIAAGGAISTGAPFMGGGMMLSGVGEIGGSIATYLDRQNKTDVGHGQLMSGSATFSSRRPSYYVYEIIADVDSLYRADEFFDMYGYATERIKSPNLTQRPNWNYVKLKMPVIKGSCPADSMDKIKNIFRTGVRLWHNAATFGDFTQNNQP